MAVEEAVYLTAVVLLHIPVLEVLGVGVMAVLRLAHRGQLVPAVLVPLIQAVAVAGALITHLLQTIKDLAAPAVLA